ncbi:MAG: long-chain fatty acid--CoA ligase [Chitinophagales bacterium]|nr:long-chain fatty acid--CoA ligase [Chitinophagales bacterium]
MEDFKRVFDLPAYQLSHYPQSDCLNEKVNSAWKGYSTQDVIDYMNRVSLSLIASGIKKGDVVSIVGNNRPQWNFTDLGIMQIGAVTVPIYPTISDDDYVYIMNDAETQILFVSSQELYDRMQNLKSRIPSLREIITYDKIPGAIHWDDFLQRGASGDPAQLQSLSDSVSEKDIACMIYTSGTTGFPKGVMLSHFNLCENMRGVDDVLPINETHRALSFLPLNHVFEKMVVYCYLMKGVSVYYAESMDTIGDNLREIKPHFFTCVPRLLEKVYERIMMKGLELKGAKRALFFWAVRLGERWENGKSMGAWYNLQLRMARRLIFSKWLEALGGNVFAICSGSAPLNAKIGKVFTAAGIVIMEGYGLTETSPVVTVNRYDTNENILGTVGPVIPGVEVKLAEDGEILVRGPNIMAGYYKLPEETKKVIDADGWFRTGDVGEWVRGKFLKITDRKKELLKTSGGKYVAPQPIENKFKESPFIEQMMVVGEGKKFVSALIVPSFPNLKSWCDRNNVRLSDNDDAVNNSKINELIQQVVNEKNQQFGHTDQIKKFKLIPEEWTVQGGQLTPTLKLKRKVIMERYKPIIDQMYADSPLDELA